MNILVLNTGSATCKWKIFNKKTMTVSAKGIEEGSTGLQTAIQKIKKLSKTMDIKIIGHRVVHGGTHFKKPTLMTKNALQALEKLTALAPLHNPHNIAGIKACKKLFPKIPNIAVFDTAFHATMPYCAKNYALPSLWYKKYGIAKYGFHGTSHAYVSQKAIQQLKKQKKPWQRMITCHLGNGCSMTALKNGKSIDTSMGFTPLEGLIMGTRSGDLDPGIIFYMQRQGITIEQIEHALLYESGLKGLSGTNDMRIILEKVQKKDIQAKNAVDAFIYRIIKYAGAYTMVLGGLDALVFTGGIGVPAGSIRKIIATAVKKITPKVSILTITTDEECAIAQQIMREFLMEKK